VTRPAALARFLDRHRIIGLDTSPFIYHLETHPRYGSVAAEVFEWLEQRGAAVTSTITMTELLVHPYRKEDLDRVNTIYALTSTYPHLSWMPVTLALADAAARLRAKYGLRTPDAIQVATAVSGAATGFIGNDEGFRRVTELEVLLLDSVVVPALTRAPARQPANPEKSPGSTG
jgi:predicted nucleic acid-binding protein